MPIDNAQKFEQLREEALFLQTLVDTDVDKDEVNSLSEVLETYELQGMSVNIVGGLVETRAYDEAMESIPAFLPNTEGVAGQYHGVAWRKESIQFPDESEHEVWRICHVIAGDPVGYVDNNGDKIVRTALTYVTVEGSLVEMQSFIGTHDYKRLALDGVALLIDQIAFNDELDLTKKAEKIARLFRKNNPTIGPNGELHTMRQRISYINELGLFDASMVLSPFAVERKEDETRLLKSQEGLLGGIVQYVGLDVAVTEQGEFVEETMALSYETVIQGRGPVSFPHIPGVTKVYPTA